VKSAPDYDPIIAEAFAAACEKELLALKPGNVHVFADGHRMTVADFRRSASAAAPFLAARGTSIGARIKAAVEASMAAVGQNTNLGIVLLCAPLAFAAGRMAGGSLREKLHKAFAGLTMEDAALTFEAIALASPGGLGKHDVADVRQPPTVGLLEAMRLAADYDRIARAYVTDFEDIFGFGLPKLEEARLGLARAEDASAPMETRCDICVTALFLEFFSAFRDSHIERKFGRERAEAVRGEAEMVKGAVWEAQSEEEKRELLLGFDASLKARGLNPGTSADFTVATLFARFLSGKRNA
jgi:triphosphoribosyl-dephospho-CoA synthase